LDRDKLRLPAVCPSSFIYGKLDYKDSPLAKVPIAGVLGDQQAALVGQRCLTPGTAKNTYGTGCFLLYNVGKEIVQSRHGLLSTVAYQMGEGQPTVYALEGAIATAGSAVAWLRDSLGFIQTSEEVEALAGEVEDTAGVVFVPALSGLLAPHWLPKARGAILGLSQAADKRHIARATLEAVCLQTR